jgi:hypothetical protein
MVSAAGRHENAVARRTHWHVRWGRRRRWRARTHAVESGLRRSVARVARRSVLSKRGTRDVVVGRRLWTVPLRRACGAAWHGCVADKWQ